MSTSTAPVTANGSSVPKDEDTELSKQYHTPLGMAHSTMQALKDRIKQHYDLASDYYLNLWGEHIHHGYWPTAESKAKESKEVAQTNLINLLLDISSLTPSPQQATTTPLRILDVGCGVGGTTRFLATHLGATVTGITISSRQVQIATRLSKQASPTKDVAADAQGFIPLSNNGQVRFLELDAEKMGEHFDGQRFDVVWISEALSHFPDKPLFFRNAAKLLVPGAGKLVVADWFKKLDLTEDEFKADISPIEDGMLLPPLCTSADYVHMAVEGAGLKALAEPKDISQEVSKTWDISWSLVQNPNLWAFAFSQGRDGLAFLQAFRAMRRGYANGSFRYAVMAFVKGE